VRPFCYRAALARARAASAAPITPVRLCNHTRWGVTSPCPPHPAVSARSSSPHRCPPHLLFLPRPSALRSAASAVPPPRLCVCQLLSMLPVSLPMCRAPTPSLAALIFVLETPLSIAGPCVPFATAQPLHARELPVPPRSPPCVSAITLAGGSHHRAPRIRQSLRAAPHPTVAPRISCFTRPSALRSAASAVPPPRLCVCQLLSMLPVSLPMCRAPTSQPGCAHLRA
jgi:hypothetical protein